MKYISKYNHSLDCIGTHLRLRFNEEAITDLLYIYIYCKYLYGFVISS